MSATVKAKPAFGTAPPKPLRVIDCAERDRVMSGNLRLVWAFLARSRVARWLLLGYFGDREELFADLLLPYVEAVDYWLASPRKFRLSTFVFRRLKNACVNLRPPAELIRVPPDCADEERQRLKGIVGRAKVVGYDSAASDRALWRWDDRGDARDGGEAEWCVKALAKLSGGRLAAVRLRYGFGDSGAHTYEEIGRVFRVSLERARQLVITAEFRIKQHCHHGRLPWPPNPEAPPPARRARKGRHNSLPGVESWQENAIRAWEDAD